MRADFRTEARCVEHNCAGTLPHPSEPPPWQTLYHASTVTKLDYESKVPQAKRRDIPGGVDVLWWIISCIGGATAGVAVVMLAAGASADELGLPRAVAALGMCGGLGAAGTMLATAPLLIFVETPRRRLALSALVGFVLMAGLLTILWVSLPALD